jgi:hypothetical protein
MPRGSVFGQPYENPIGVGRRFLSSNFSVAQLKFSLISAVGCRRRSPRPRKADMGIPRNRQSMRGADAYPTFIVRSGDGRVLLALAGADAADAAIDWVERGYEVDETDAMPFRNGPAVAAAFPVSA